MEKKFLILFVLFIISCSQQNKIKVVLDSSEDLNTYIEAINSDFKLENKDFNIELIKFNNFKELYTYINEPVNTADLIITNSKNIKILEEENLIKLLDDDLVFIQDINSKALSTVRKLDNLRAIPFAVAKKKIIYVNTSLNKDIDIHSLEDINKFCFSYEKTCFDIYPDFKLASIIYANIDDKEATIKFFDDNISRGKISGVLNINDARNRFLESKTPLLFDYDSNYKIYSNKLSPNLKIYKLPAAASKILKTNNETVAVAIYKNNIKDEAFLLNYIQYFTSEKTQSNLMNDFNRLAVLNKSLEINNLNNSIKIISYRQFELSTLIEEKELINIYSIFTDK